MTSCDQLQRSMQPLIKGHSQRKEPTIKTLQHLCHSKWRHYNHLCKNGATQNGGILTCFSWRHSNLHLYYSKWRHWLLGTCLVVLVTGSTRSGELSKSRSPSTRYEVRASRGTASPWGKSRLAFYIEHTGRGMTHPHYHIWREGGRSTNLCQLERVKAAFFTAS